MNKVKKPEYDFKVLSTKPMKHGKITRLSITKKGGDIDAPEVYTLWKMLESESKKNNLNLKINIGGYTPIGYKTFKGMDEDFLNMQDYLDYFNGKVEDVHKFGMLKSVVLTVSKSYK